MSFHEAIVRVAEQPTLLGGLGERIKREFELISKRAVSLSGEVELAFDPLAGGAIVDGLRPAAEEMIVDADERAEVLSYLAKVSDDFEPVDLEGLLHAVSVGSKDTEQNLAKGAINVLTMHKAKGLTAKAVIVAAVEDELIPGLWKRRTRNADNRRLLYVSLTRAEHFLILSYCQRRVGLQKWTGRERGREARTLTRFPEMATLANTGNGVLRIT